MLANAALERAYALMKRMEAGESATLSTVDVERAADEAVEALSVAPPTARGVLIAHAVLSRGGLAESADHTPDRLPDSFNAMRASVDARISRCAAATSAARRRRR